MLRLIQIGVGGFGWSWTDIVLQNPNISLVGMVDINEQVLEKAIEERGLPKEIGFTDLRKAIDSQPADAVLIVTPPASHRELGEIALEAGLHVLCEKPLSDNMEDAKAMVKRSKESGKILMVSQNYRFSRPARTAKKATERIGKIGYVDISFHKAPRFEGFRRTMPYPLLIDMSIHHFDLLRFLTGRDPLSISAFSWRPSWSWFEGDPCLCLFVELEDNVKGGYFGSWVSIGAETPWAGVWRIQGEKGAVVWNEEGVFVADDEKIELLEMVDLPWEDRAYVLEEFRLAVEEGRNPECSGEDNLKSLAMVFASLASINQGEPVRVSDFLK